MDVRLKQAKLETTHEHLSTTIKQLSEVVTELTAAMNKGSGAIWAVASLGGAIGAVGSWIASHWGK